MKRRLDFRQNENFLAVQCFLLQGRRRRRGGFQVLENSCKSPGGTWTYEGELQVGPEVEDEAVMSNLILYVEGGGWEAPGCVRWNTKDPNSQKAAWRKSSGFPQQEGCHTLGKVKYFHWLHVDFTISKPNVIWFQSLCGISSSGYQPQLQVMNHTWFMGCKKWFMTGKGKKVFTTGFIVCLF